MSQRRGWWPLALATLVACAGPLQARAAGPSVRVAQCAIEIKTHDATLRDTLAVMAARLKFEFHDVGGDNPTVRLDDRLSPEAAMERLSRIANLAVQYRYEKRCPGQLQIAAVWLLPRQSTASSVPLPPPPAIPQESPATQLPLADALKPEAAEELYLRAHGAHVP